MTPSRAIRFLALALHGALMLGLPLATGVTGLVLVLPLLFPLPGLWRGRPYTYAWCSLLILFYLGGFLMEAFARAEIPAAVLVLAVVSALEFCALLLYVRFRAAERRATTAG